MNLEQATKCLEDIVAYLNSSKEKIDEAKATAQAIEEAIKNGQAASMANHLQEMTKPFYSGCMEALNNNAFFSDAKHVAGQAADAAMSPAVLMGAKIAVIAVSGIAGPVGLGLALGAVAAEVAIGASFANELSVLHDEALHLQEYAGFRENKQKLIEDITLKCQLEDPSITPKDVKKTLKTVGITVDPTQKLEKPALTNKLPEEIESEEKQAQFKETMATNFAINSVITFAGKNPALFLQALNPVGLAVTTAVVVGKTLAQTVTQMNEEEASKQIQDRIAALRETGPEYKTHTDIDPDSLEYSFNEKANSFRRLIGAEEQDPSKKAVSRKYDLAEAALKAKVSAETLDQLSQNPEFISGIADTIRQKREHKEADKIEQELREKQGQANSHAVAKELNQQITVKKKELEKAMASLAVYGSAYVDGNFQQFHEAIEIREEKSRTLHDGIEELVISMKNLQTRIEEITEYINEPENQPEKGIFASAMEFVGITDETQELQDELREKQEEWASQKSELLNNEQELLKNENALTQVKGKLEKLYQLTSSIESIEGSIKMLETERNWHLDQIRKVKEGNSEILATYKDNLIRENFDVVGTQLDAAKATELYSDEQIQGSSALKSVQSAARNTVTYLKSAGSYVKTHDSMVQDLQESKERITEQKDRVEASIAGSREKIEERVNQEKINALAQMIEDPKSKPQEVIEYINTLDEKTFKIALESGQTIIEYLEAKSVDSKVLDAAKSRKEFWDKTPEERVRIEQESEASKEVQRIKSEQQIKMNQLVEMLDNPNGKTQAITSYIKTLDAATLQTPVNGKSIIEHVAEKNMPSEILETAILKGGFKPEQAKQARVLQAGVQNTIAQEKLKGEQTAQIIALVNMIKNPKTSKNDMLESIKRLNEETLKIPVDGKSVVEHIAENNAGATIMKEVLGRAKFEVSDIKKAQRSLNEKTLGASFSAHSRRHTTKKNLREALDKLSSPTKTNSTSLLGKIASVIRGR